MTSPCPEKLPNSFPPTTVSDLRNGIGQGLFRVSRKAPDVLRYALENPFEVAFGSGLSIAKNCKVSPTTLHKILAGIGFKHFAEFRDIFREELQRKNRNAIRKHQAERDFL